MGKIGGLAAAAVVALALAGCSAPEPTVQTAPQPTTTIKWITKAGQPFNISTVKFDSTAAPRLKAAAAEIPGYADMSQDELATIGRDLCEHYASGWDTEDLRQSGGDTLAAIGEAAKGTVCATR